MRWPQPGDRPPLQPGQALRRGAILFGAGAVVLILVVALHGVGASSFPVPSKSALSGLSLRQRIVVIAESQVGYRTDPSNSYCNKFSAYWKAGTPNCPGGNYREEWCADFAAWAWNEAGALVTYQFVNGDLNSSAASFYEWGLRHGTWHPLGSAYRPKPGDVAVYGLDPANLTAVHVAVVTDFSPGAKGPDVVNGDGDHGGYSLVEKGTNQFRIDVGGSSSELSGYVSPLPTTS